MKTLIVAGTGIKFLSHLTIEVKAVIEQSSCVIYLLNEPAMKRWIFDHSKKSISMDDIYFSSSLRKDAYSDIADAVLRELNNYDDVVFLTYGHPVFFSSITSELIKKIQKEPANLHIMPGISALDSLCADLRIDPGLHGLQSYEATEFILHDHAFSTRSHLILWQIAVLGETGIISEDYINTTQQKKSMQLLVEKLIAQYPKNHQASLYVAAQYPGVKYDNIPIALDDLLTTKIPRLATLYIPPCFNK